MLSSESDLLEWPIFSGRHAEGVLPRRLLTTRPRLVASAIPIEVALLLPTNAGNRDLLAKFEREPFEVDAMLGLCLVDPFLHLSSAADRLRRSGVIWVCSFPTVAQHDPVFESYLNDVDLGLRNELARLSSLKASGFRTMSVLCHQKDAALVAAAKPDAIIYVPTVAEFLNGVPDQTTLTNKKQLLAEALAAEGWVGPLLDYRLTPDTHANNEPALIRPTIT